jgi:hypothetical protein
MCLVSSREMQATASLYNTLNTIIKGILASCFIGDTVVYRTLRHTKKKRSSHGTCTAKQSREIALPPTGNKPFLLAFICNTILVNNSVNDRIVFHMAPFAPPPHLFYPVAFGFYRPYKVISVQVMYGGPPCPSPDDGLLDYCLSTRLPLMGFIHSLSRK